MLKQTTNRILDLIYPASCHLCECALTNGRHLCDPCRYDLPSVEPPFCSRCGECYNGKITDQFICPNCHQLEFHFEFAIAALHSHGGGRELVHNFKYMRQIHLADELARLIQTTLTDKRFQPYLNDGLFVPVPLHWIRQRKRRFNQAEEISKKLSRHTNIPCLKVLKRIRNTHTQTRFSRTKRLENLNAAFALNTRYKKRIQGKPVILIDDVFTTGSTANECAKVLIQNGAEKVAILTVLRG